MTQNILKTQSVSKGRVLVTGGAGYIGSHAVVALCDAGYTVTVVDNLSAGAREAVDSRAEFVELDMGDEVALARLFGIEKADGDVPTSDNQNGLFITKNGGKSLRAQTEIQQKEPDGKSVHVHRKVQQVANNVKSSQAVQFVPRFDAVMHFAGNIEVALSMKEPARFFENNVVNGVKLLEAMRAGGVKQIIFSSTAAVYGNPVGGSESVKGFGVDVGEFSPHLITESDPLDPTNFYGLTKLQFEGILSAYTRLHGFRYVALRYFNAAGLGQSGGGKAGSDDSVNVVAGGPILAERHDPETHLIPLLLKCARAHFLKKSARADFDVRDGKRRRDEDVEDVSDAPIFQMYGDDYPTPDGTCIRDYIHVRDLVDAHVKALAYLLQGGKSEVMNLGNGKGFSVKEVMEAARAAWGVEIPFEVAARREGDPAVLVADARRAHDILAWQPVYGLPEILKSVWTGK